MHVDIYKSETCTAGIAGTAAVNFEAPQSAGIYDETWLAGNYGLLLLNSSAVIINNCV